MLKKKIWIPLLILIGITGGFFFWQYHTALIAPIIVYPTDIDPGDTPQTSQQPKAETETVTDTGHYHEDGTFHAEPHAPVESRVEAPVAATPQPVPPETLSEEELQKAKMLMLFTLPEKLEFMRRSRDKRKRHYEFTLRTLKRYEEQDYSPHIIEECKETVAKAKANLDRYEMEIYHLEKWRDEDAKYLLPVNAQIGDDAFWDYYNYNKCDWVRLLVQDEIKSADRQLKKLEIIREYIKNELENNAENLREGVRTVLVVVAAAGGDLGPGASALINQEADTMDGAALLSLFNDANSAISSQLGVINGIYTRANTGYDAVYDHYVAAYEALSDEDKGIIQRAMGRPNGLDPKKGSPSADTYSLVQCGRPSSLSPTCYGYYTDANHHKETCSLKHGTSGETNVAWWSCFDSQCTRYPEHWVPCRASNCNVLFPPPTVIVHRLRTHVYTTKLYHDHEVTCQASVYSFLNPWAKCGRKYFTCEGACPDRNRHTSGSGSTPPPSACPASSWAPNCDGSADHTATCQSGHTYYTCGQPSNVEWHTSGRCTPPPSACPAKSWIPSCDGLTDHTATCRSGHTYYTCSAPSNVRWHVSGSCRF